MYMYIYVYLRSPKFQQPDEFLLRVSCLRFCFPLSIVVCCYTRSGALQSGCKKMFSPKLYTSCSSWRTEELNAGCHANELTRRGGPVHKLLSLFSKTTYFSFLKNTQTEPGRHTDRS